MDRRTRAERRADAQRYADAARAVERAVARAARAATQGERARRADFRAQAAALVILDAETFDADALLDSLE